MKSVFKIGVFFLFCFSAFQVQAENIKAKKQLIESELANNTYLIDHRGPGGVGFNGYGQYFLQGVYLGSNKKSLVIGAYKNTRPIKHIKKPSRILPFFWKVKWFSGNRYGVCYNRARCIEVSQFRKMKIGSGDVFKLKDRNSAKSTALIVR